MRYFVLAYDQKTGKLLSLDEFAEDDRDDAARLRFQKELAARSTPTVEVVMLGAESRTVIERTHARYFQSVGELAANG